MYHYIGSTNMDTLLCSTALAAMAVISQHVSESEIIISSKSNYPLKSTVTLLNEALPYIVMNGFIISEEIKVASYADLKFTSYMDLLLYTIAYVLISDLIFFIYHKLSHDIKTVYYSIHRIHHASTKGSRINSFDFFKVHMLEAFLTSLPIAFMPHLLPIVPLWHHIYLSSILVLFDLIGHSTYNLDSKKSTVSAIITLYTMPFAILSFTFKLTTGSNLFLHPSHHHIHHMEYNFNYGQFTKIWDKIFGTFKSKSGKKESYNARYAINVLVCVLQFYLLVYSTIEVSLMAYCAIIIYELLFCRINTTLKYFHHPLFLTAASYAYKHNLTDLMWYYVLSNVIQIPSYVALHNKSGYKKASIWALTCKVLLIVGLYVYHNNKDSYLIAFSGFYWQLQGAKQLYLRG